MGIYCHKDTIISALQLRKSQKKLKKRWFAVKNITYIGSFV